MHGITGTGTLIRLALRRERIAIPIWALLVVFLLVGQAQRYLELMPTEAARQTFAEEAASNRVLIAFAGQLYGTSVAALTIWRNGDTAIILLALMIILTVIRHTRAEEESGRHELVGAGIVGRFAPLTASLIVACGGALLAGMMIVVGFVGLGFDLIGATAFGLAVMGVGWVFAGVSALAAQFTESARGAITLAASVLGISYLLRFTGDGLGEEWLVWLSPIGWSSRVQPFGAERWWIFGLMFTTALTAALAAYWLSARRDLGSGLLPPRLGPATSSSLRSPLALAWRLQRGLLTSWALLFAVIAVFTGALTRGLPELVRQSSEAQEFLLRYSGSADASITNIYLELILVSMGMTVALYTALAALRLHSEEVSGRADLVLSTATSRMRWVASHFAFALLGTAVVMAAGGGVFGLVDGLMNGNLATELPRVLLGALLYVPAAWTVGGLTVLLFGVAPRVAVAMSWAVFIYINFVGELFGPILFGASYQTANALQPFHYIPKITSGGGFTAMPLLVLVSITLMFAAAGVFAFRRRDVG